jgi:hypothetical protein
MTTSFHHLAASLLCRQLILHKFELVAVPLCKPQKPNSHERSTHVIVHSVDPEFKVFECYTESIIYTADYKVISPIKMSEIQLRSKRSVYLSIFLMLLLIQPFHSSDL